MKLIGLTGGVGSGKSEAARRFAHFGVPTIDADAIGHAILLPGGSAEAEVLKEFGQAIVTDGHINRTLLGARVFNDDAARLRLNAIVHPRIAAETAKRCAEFAEHGHARVILDAALLGESGTKESYLDSLILVLAPLEDRVQRLVRLRGLDEEDARRRIAAQTPPENKLAMADRVIQNNADLPHLYRQVDEIVQEWGKVLDQ